MKNIIIFILIAFISQDAFSQIKDTVYIYFDCTLVGMKKDTFVAFRSKKYSDEKIANSYTYKVEEKKHANSYLFDTGYTFTHYHRGKFDIERGEVNPLVIRKDTSFLKSKIILNNDFFQTFDYREVCKTFEEEDNRKQDVIIFIIDKDEIKNDKIILREVKFSRPYKE